MSSNFPYLTRNDPLGQSTKRFRSTMAGDPRFFGLDSAGLVRKYNGNLPTGATTLYTCPTWRRALTMPGVYMIHNPTAGAIAFDFHHVPAGGSVNNNNKMAAIASIAADETRTLTVGALSHVVMPGDSLVINPGTIGLNAWGVFHENLSDACAFIGGAVNNIAATTETTVLTCPATRTLVLMNVIGRNYNVGTANMSAHARESGVSASDANEIMMAAAVASGALLERDRYKMVGIGEGGVFSALSSVTNVNFWFNALIL